MREIITLQLGQQSNYLANHFWNAQESYFTYGADEETPVDHDVHFRPGIGSDGTETFMPRTVIYDLKGGFGTLRKINSLYEIDGDPSSSSLWSGQTVIQRQQPIEASAYQESLDAGQAPAELTTSTVRYWSDFNRVFYHPKSIIQLSEYELNSTVMPFEKWHMGEELFGSLDKEHDLLDRDLRPFVEEADQMQGVQIMTGIDDAWGGFVSKYMERLRDEYGKTPVWVFGAQEPHRGLPRVYILIIILLLMYITYSEIGEKTIKTRQQGSNSFGAQFASFISNPSCVARATTATNCPARLLIALACICLIRCGFGECDSLYPVKDIRQGLFE